MMSQNKREIVAERMRRIRFDMDELQKDLKKLKDEYESDSEERSYLGFVIDEQDSAFTEATQWFDDLIYFLENNKIMESEEEES